jgi:hypothetical protein
MRPKATRQGNWVQLWIGAAALLLPPLALGAAFYSMLAEPDEVVTRPAAAQAVAPAAAPPVAPPGMVGADAALQPSTGKLTEGAPPKRERLPVQGSRVQAAPIQATTVATAPPATISPPADVEGLATPPAAESPPASAVAPKRPVHRRRQSQDPYPVRTWLQEIGQEIGILPRNGKNSGG